MSRPVVTASVLDEMLRAGKQIVLPKNALLTPAARDWFRDHRLTIQWIEDSDKPKRTLAAVLDTTQAQMRSLIPTLERLCPTEVISPAAVGLGPLASAVRRLCGKVNRREVSKGVVFTTDAFVPLVVANKHDGIRAIQGTNLSLVQDACRELAVNVLVIDTATHSTFQTKQMIERLLAGSTAAPAEMAAIVEVVERSGGREDW